MEINTVPEFLAEDADGTLYTRIPQLQFPVDDTGRTVLVRDVVMYSKDALWNDVLAWRRGGDAPTGAFKADGMARPEIHTRSVTYRQNKKKITGINELATPTVFDGNVFGLTWSDDVVVEDGMAKFPTFFRDAGETRESITAADVPAKTTLRDRGVPGAAHEPPALHRRAPVRFVGNARSRSRPVRDHAARRLHGALLLVSLHRPAGVPAVPVVTEDAR